MSERRHVDGGDTEEDRYMRLGAAVRRRRLQLGLTQDHVGERGGPSHQTLRTIEAGKRNQYRDRTYALLENVLDWKPGTVAAVLTGTADPDPEKWVQTGALVHTKRAVIANRGDPRGLRAAAEFVVRELDAANARIAALEAVARDLVDSANLMDDSTAAIVDRAPVDRFIALLDARED